MIGKKETNRRDRIELILSGLVGVGLNTADLVASLVDKFIVDHFSYKRIREKMAGYTRYLEEREVEELKRVERQRFRSSLQYLKKCGFIAKKERGGLFFWNLTEKGRLHINAIKSRRMRYKKEKAGGTIIVSYDIPEYSKNNRDWAREVLKFLDFSMVHKSLWIGGNKIPEDFIHDLKVRCIFSYVHIFEVGERGTLVKLR